MVDAGLRVGVQSKLMTLRSHRTFGPFHCKGRVKADVEKVLSGWCDECHIDNEVAPAREPPHMALTVMAIPQCSQVSLGRIHN